MFLFSLIISIDILPINPGIPMTEQLFSQSNGIELEGGGQVGKKTEGLRQKSIKWQTRISNEWQAETNLE